MTHQTAGLTDQLKEGDTFDSLLGVLTVVRRTNFSNETHRTCRLLLKRDTGEQWSVDL